MPKVPTLTFNNGFKIPIIGLGTWKSPKGQVEQAVKDAIDAGYRHFDCAYIYQNEEEIGNAIALKIKENVVKREDLFITSKLWNTYHNPKDVRGLLTKTLKDLQLSYLDLYLIHWPMSYDINVDEKFPKDANGEFVDGGFDIIDTWKEMEKLIDDGLVKSIGVSNFNARQITRVLENARIRPVTNQVECHPYLNQSRLQAFCQEREILITAYSPLGSPDRPWRVEGETHLIDEPVILKIAKSHNKTAAQVLFRYQIQRGIIVIPKSVTKERIISNIDVFDFEISADEMKEIDGMNCNKRLCPESSAKNHRDYPFNDEF